MDDLFLGLDNGRNNVKSEKRVLFVIGSVSCFWSTMRSRLTLMCTGLILLVKNASSVVSALVISSTLANADNSLEVAKSLQTKIYCDARKAAIIRCQSDLDLESMLTEDPLEAMVHVVPLGLINPDKLKLYANQWKERFHRVIGLRPTGWTSVVDP
jgi:DNA repair metallo-beta-lactamase